MKHTIAQACILVATLTAVIVWMAITDARGTLALLSGRSGAAFSSSVTAAHTAAMFPADGPLLSLRPESSARGGDKECAQIGNASTTIRTECRTQIYANGAEGTAILPVHPLAMTHTCDAPRRSGNAQLRLVTRGEGWAKKSTALVLRDHSAIGESVAADALPTARAESAESAKPDATYGSGGAISAKPTSSPAFRDTAPRVTGGGRSKKYAALAAKEDSWNGTPAIAIAPSNRSALNHAALSSADAQFSPVASPVPVDFAQSVTTSTSTREPSAPPNTSRIPVEQRDPAAYGTRGEVYRDHDRWVVGPAPMPTAATAPPRRALATQSTEPAAAQGDYEWVLTAPITASIAPPGTESIAWLFVGTPGSYGFGALGTTPKVPLGMFAQAGQVEQGMVICYRGKDGKDIECLPSTGTGSAYVVALPATECAP